ncbi:MAG: hypothetical protein GY945_10795 [Rhodobacteraceae bacterium]|nr:hypothetical protein [Paracoccaceae bacterium]
MPVLAQDTLTGTQFDAATRGKTFHFSVEGETYGGEQYLPGRQVWWSFLDGQCKRGNWYEAAGSICFVYEDEPDASCWRFSLDGDGLYALLTEDEDDKRTYVARPVQDHLFCRGPEVGV